ncbi:MAG: 30S ribosomal protein S17 [Patescibacteria group bacterium]
MNNKQRKSGRVVSAQMASTVVVSVDAFVGHPLYHKKIRTTHRFLAHNAENKAKLGDWVTIEESRPLSKLKRWVVIDIKSGGDQKTVTEDIQEVDTALSGK